MSILGSYESKKKAITTLAHRNNRISELWTHYMVENNVALHSVDSHSFAQLTHEIFPEWKCPERHVFSRKYLPALSRVIEDKMGALLKQKGDDFVSVEFDHWSDINGKSILGILLTLNGGDRYLLSLVDVSLEGHSAEKTLPILMKEIRKIPANCINSIVSDSASACKLTRELIVKQPGYQRIIQHRCLAPLLNRMGSDFASNNHVKG